MLNNDKKIEKLKREDKKRPSQLVLPNNKTQNLAKSASQPQQQITPKASQTKSTQNNNMSKSSVLMFFFHKLIL